MLGEHQLLERFITASDRWFCQCVAIFLIYSRDERCQFLIYFVYERYHR